MNFNRTAVPVSRCCTKLPSFLLCRGSRNLSPQIHLSSPTFYRTLTKSATPRESFSRTIHAKPITVSAYAKYGGVISTDVVNDKTVVVNGGTARRTPEVVPTENFYQEAPSGRPARTVLNASLATPRDLTTWRGDDSGNGSADGREKKVLVVNMLERHRFSTQSFIPMGSNVKYLVIVTDGGDEPNLGNLEAFVASDKQGVCYGRAVWHAPLAVVGDQDVPFAVVQNVNGVADEDCQFFPLEEGLKIVF